MGRLPGRETVTGWGTREFEVERVRRIELPYQAWEACVLPLNYTHCPAGFNPSW